MALSSINISITNNSTTGMIEIVSTKQENASNQIMYALISRRKHNTEDDYIRVYEKLIISLNDLNFTDVDMFGKSGTSYDYYIELTDGNTTGYETIEFGEVNNVECWFDGLFIGNDNKQYFAPLNCNTSYTRNTQSNYVTTLSGRTPYRISNTNLNYTTGKSTGLFVPLDEQDQPVPQSIKDYINEVVDFLSDGTEKILKTSDGNAWYISIDPSISVSFDDRYVGSSMIDFSWTEIGDMPTLKRVVPS